MADDPRIEAVAERLAMQDGARPLKSRSNIVQVYYRELAASVLAAADEADPLRALLADEDRALDLLAGQWFNSIDGSRRWAQCSPAVKATHRKHMGPVLAALREVVGL